MRADWTPIPKPDWDALAAYAPLQQHWAFGAAMRRMGAGIRRAVVWDGDTPVALAQFTVRNVYNLADWALCTRGPHWLAPLEESAKAEIYHELRRTAPLRRPRAIFFTPDEEGSPLALRLAGLRRVMTGYSTALLDLRRDPDEALAAMDGKWRRRMRAAERTELRLQPNGLKPGQYDWLLRAEQAQRTAKGYAALPTELTPAYQEASGEPRALRIFRADLGRKPAAAMLFLLHGRVATYHIGWAGEEGRKRGAHNLILWNAMRELAAAGIETLDLGGVNTESGAGIARFKLGSGGRPITLCGAYF